MEHIEKRINLTTSNLVVLFGVHDSHLRLLEQRFDCEIITRGDSMAIRGDAPTVDLVEKVVRELIFIVNKTESLSEKDILTVIEILQNGSGFEVAPEEVDSIVLYTQKDYIKVRTPGQAAYMRAIHANDIVFAIGPAGTGKTFLAVAAAVASLKRHDVQKIVLVRPAVEAGESLGFLPGDLRDKVDPYLRPLYDALEDMLPLEKLKTYLERRTIEIVPLAYMRGRTLNNAFIILDEAQNATGLQMKMFLTRLGNNSRAIITGDITQIDLPMRTTSGLVEIQDILTGVDGVAFVYFDKSDVVRHKLVKDIIDAYERYGGEEG